MPARHVLGDYISAAMAEAVYDRLDDGTFAGRIRTCVGVVAFAETLEACQDELRSALNGWILVGLKLGHRLPVLGGVDTNLDAVPTDRVSAGRRTLGSARGKIQMAPDFDAPLPDEVLDEFEG